MTHPRGGWTACLATLAVVLQGCGGGGSGKLLTDYAGDARFPQEYWPTAAPEDVGLSSAVLDDSTSSVLGLDSILVVRHGKLVYERYGSLYDPHARHIQWCVTKSVLSALAGIAIEEGYLGGVDDLVLPYFASDAIASVTPAKARMTIEDLLTMRSGRAPWPDDPPTFTAFEVGLHALQAPMGAEPGTTFSYTDGDPAILASLLQRALGRSPQDYAEEKLFAPLGIIDWAWDADAAGIGIPYRLHLRPRDMAKLGQLYLQRGAWEGAQVVPAAWVDRSFATVVPRADEDGWGYGYLWWKDPLGGSDALGMQGQRIVVVPSKDLVIAFTAQLPSPAPLNDVEARIVDSAE